MRNSAGGAAAGLGATALAALLLGAVAAPAHADGFQDAKVVCSADAGDVCAHVQYTDDPTTPLVRAVGTAADGHQVTIVKVTLVERTYYMGVGGQPTQVAETDQTVDSGGSLTAATASADKQSGVYKTSVFYDAAVTYRIAGGTETTVTATDNPVIPFP